ncbi:MAG: peptidoglycan recognition protein family protein [Planctomycetota bacterium]|jgi:hypothetical protein|nr:peptidoglycan recognition protein family protein [Planctomycetota bacterium]
MNREDEDPGGGAAADPERREFLLLAAAGVIALAIPGCGQPYAYSPPEKAKILRPNLHHSVYTSPSIGSEPAANVVPVQLQSAPVPVQSHYPLAGGLTALSRNSWGAAPADPKKMQAMDGVTRITIHHEGSAKPNNDSAPAQAAATIRLIQGQHRKRMGAGDIGYHFIIDRAGTIWQGRDWRFQGAHTSGANPHNIGVMLLGNFDIQQPSQPQTASLHRLTASLARKYGLNPAAALFGHSDFGATQCPGRNLKPQVTAMRRFLRV